MDHLPGVLVQGDIARIETVTIMSKARRTTAETPRLKILIKMMLLVGFLVFVNYGGSRIVSHLNFQLWPEHEKMIITALWVSIVIYILWMALPFVPGIELGLALMVMLGPQGVLLVYMCTLLSLSLSFAIGRLISLKAFARFMGWLHLHKARDLVLKLEPLDPQEKFDVLLKSAPSKILPFMLEHRYLVVALMLNQPGNALIGVGGGIGLIAGMSRLCSFPRYLLLVSVAITPLPFLFIAGKLPG